MCNLALDKETLLTSQMGLAAPHPEQGPSSNLPLKRMAQNSLATFRWMWVALKKDDPFLLYTMPYEIPGEHVQSSRMQTKLNTTAQVRHVRSLPYAT